MRWLGTISITIVMVCVSVVPLSCKEPSTLAAPPWFGGERVEIPEDGFALTVPDGWVAFDTTVDAAGQISAAAGYVDPDIWSPDDASDADLLTAAAATGFTLMLVDGRNTCGVNPDLHATTSPDVVADTLASALATRGPVEPPRRLDLPAGPAFMIRAGISEGDGAIGDAIETIQLFQSSAFVLGDQASVVLTVVCQNLITRTDDLWLSVVESIGFLSAEE